jgi:hypothetical protein
MAPDRPQCRPEAGSRRRPTTRQAQKPPGASPRRPPGQAGCAPGSERSPTKPPVRRPWCGARKNTSFGGVLRKNRAKNTQKPCEMARTMRKMSRRAPKSLRRRAAGGAPVQYTRRAQPTPRPRRYKAPGERDKRRASAANAPTPPPRHHAQAPRTRHTQPPRKPRTPRTQAAPAHPAHAQPPPTPPRARSDRNQVRKPLMVGRGGAGGRAQGAPPQEAEGLLLRAIA